jgi:hypothetical protein
MCWPDASQAQPTPIQIQLRAISNTTVEITETNTSKQNVDFPCGNPTIKVYVTTRGGTAADDTDEGVRYKDALRNERFNSQTACVTVSLKQGQSVSYPMDISRLYKLTNSSGYSVRVEQIIEGKYVAGSNSVTLRAK